MLLVIPSCPKVRGCVRSKIVFQRWTEGMFTTLGFVGGELLAWMSGRLQNSEDDDGSVNIKHTKQDIRLVTFPSSAFARVWAKACRACHGMSASDPKSPKTYGPPTALATQKLVGAVETFALNLTDSILSASPLP
jgi:hypothetical protein